MQASSRIIASSYNIEMDEQPFIRVDSLYTPELEQRILQVGMGKRTVVFTSKNGVASVVQMLRGKQPEWDIYCLEGATRQAVHHYFLKATIKQDAKSAGDLVRMIDVNDVDKSVVFFCGNKRMDTIPELMKGMGVPLEEIIVYQTLYTPSIIMKKYDGILFFSKSAVESFAAANRIPVKTALFAIGDTTAKALKDYVGATLPIIQSPSPSEKTLIETIIDFYKR
jgi:uroporphyrinogen-III synthase